MSIIHNEGPRPALFAGKPAHKLPWTAAEIRAFGALEYGVRDADGEIIRYLGNVPKALAEELADLSRRAMERDEAVAALCDLQDIESTRAEVTG